MAGLNVLTVLQSGCFGLSCLFSLQVDLVVPSSHCWTPHSGIYIGCRGGQLLLADFDSMTLKVLANPRLSQVTAKCSVCWRV